MKCPFCNHPETRVLESRDSAEALRRRRECQKCQKRFTTYERVEVQPLIIVKKNGKEEPFDRTKLRRGILLACEKRPIKLEKIEEIIDSIRRNLIGRKKTHVPSRVVGSLVMSKLKALDTVAYMRFASVYREFDNIKSFIAEASTLEKKKAEKGNQDNILVETK
ncbi:transcriptional repressor NrdR [Candidatus Woesearchaeota archaeon]|nr:transcriptional repressor NrdR [Candidatus Woesearchaeota archaeon]